MYAIDGKYKILAINPCTGNHHTEYDGVFFSVKDVALPELLEHYVRICKENKCDEGQIMGAEALLGRVQDWQKSYPDKVKRPDVSNDCELDHVMNPGEI